MDTFFIATTGGFIVGMVFVIGFAFYLLAVRYKALEERMIRNLKEYIQKQPLEENNMNEDIKKGFIYLSKKIDAMEQNLNSRLDAIDEMIGSEESEETEIDDSGDDEFEEMLEESTEEKDKELDYVGTRKTKTVPPLPKPEKKGIFGKKKEQTPTPE